MTVFPPARLRKAGPRRGAVAAEFALFLPLLATLTIGMFEVGRGILAKELLCDAARDGARAAALPNTSTADVQSEVTAVLKDHGITSPKVKVTVLVNDKAADASTAVRNDKIAVSVSIPTSEVAWTSSFFFLGSQAIQSEAVTMMRQ
jgi:Flp pilus assembly protein TadG